MLFAQKNGNRTKQDDIRTKGIGIRTKRGAIRTKASSNQTKRVAIRTKDNSKRTKRATPQKSSSFFVIYDAFCPRLPHLPSFCELYRKDG